MGKGPRGKRRREIVEETDGNLHMQPQSTIIPAPSQDIPTLPAKHRYPTRRPNVVPGQCASSTTPLRYPLRNIIGTSKPSSIAARRVLLKTNDKPYQASREVPTLKKSPHPNRVPTSPATSSSYSSPNPKNDKSGKNAGNPIFTESEDQSPPVSKEVLDVQKLTSAILSQSERPEELHPVFPLIQASGNLTKKNFHTTEANVESNVKTDVPEKIATSQIGNAHLLSQSPSLNFTEIAQMSNDHFLDDEEVDSAIDPALVTVNGYRVKEEAAPLVRAILARYGDIAKDCTLDSPRSRSFFLEMICRICQKLEKSRFVEITTSELNALLQDIYDLKRSKIDVQWLHQRMDEISHAKHLLGTYSDLKKENARNMELIERKEEELAVLQQKVLLAEDELAAMKIKAEESNKKVTDIKEKTIAFCRKSLMHGLL